MQLNTTTTGYDGAEECDQSKCDLYLLWIYINENSEALCSAYLVFSSEAVADIIIDTIMPAERAAVDPGYSAASDEKESHASHPSFDSACLIPKSKCPTGLELQAAAMPLHSAGALGLHQDGAVPQRVSLDRVGFR